ncbi:MAG: membrane trafficking protein [Clostridiaceae bacterium]|jgi:ADP-dependent phosphofructokinase/glucokinase|nr:membrane trafficking protein [Clostridiaceae bacterium]
MDLNKKLAEMLGKMDEKVLQAKLNAALDMLKKGKTEELAKKINKIDKNELMDKIRDFDESKIKDLNINLDEIKSKVTEQDLQNLKNLVGENGDEIIAKIKDIIK